MKRTIFVFIFIVVGIIGVSCHRNDYCEKGINGYFVYLSSPYILDNKLIKAYFIPVQPAIDSVNINANVINELNSDGYLPFISYRIYGKIPGEFTNRVDTPIKVKCQLHSYSSYGFNENYIDKLSCISFEP